MKRETLKLIETFLDKAEDQSQIGKQFVPPMMDPVLVDYARNLPNAKELEVLSLFATIINKYKVSMTDDVPHIFEVVFQCTLEMITKNFQDYPEHRLKFFSLLRAIATHCFQALILLSSELLVFDDLELPTHKTKNIMSYVKQMEETRKLLLVDGGPIDEKLKLATQNLHYVNVLPSVGSICIASFYMTHW